MPNFFEVVNNYKLNPTTANKEALLAELPKVTTEAILYAIHQVEEPSLIWEIFTRHRALFAESDLVEIARDNPITAHQLLKDKVVRESLSAEAWFEILLPHPHLAKHWLPTCKALLEEAENPMLPYVSKLACRHPTLWSTYIEPTALTDLTLFLATHEIQTTEQANQLVPALTSSGNAKGLGVLVGRFNLNIPFTVVSGRQNQTDFIYQCLLHRPQALKQYSKQLQYLNFDQLFKLTHQALTRHYMMVRQLTGLLIPLINSIKLTNANQLNKVIEHLPWLLDSIIDIKCTLNYICERRGINLLALALIKEEYARHILSTYKADIAGELEKIFERYPNLIDELDLNFFNDDHPVISNHRFLKASLLLMQAKLAANKLNCLEEIDRSVIDRFIRMILDYPSQAKSFLESLRKTRLIERLTVTTVKANPNLQYFISQLYRAVGAHCEHLDEDDRTFFQAIKLISAGLSSVQLHTKFTRLNPPYHELDDPDVVADFSMLYTAKPCQVDSLFLEPLFLQAVLSRAAYRDLLADYDWPGLAIRNVACYEVILAHSADLDCEDETLVKPNSSADDWLEERSDFVSNLTTNSGLLAQDFDQSDLMSLPGFTCLFNGGICYGLSIMWALHYQMGRPQVSFIAKLRQEMEADTSERACLDAAVKISELQDSLKLETVKEFDSKFSTASWSDSDFNTDKVYVLSLPQHVINVGRVTDSVTGQQYYTFFCANKGEHRYPLAERETFLHCISELVLSYQELDDEFECKLLNPPSLKKLNELGLMSDSSAELIGEQAAAAILCIKLIHMVLTHAAITPTAAADIEPTTSCAESKLKDNTVSTSRVTSPTSFWDTTEKPPVIIKEDPTVIKAAVALV